MAGSVTPDSPISPPATPPSGDFIIDLHHVEKTYRRKVHALRGIEMQVGRGEIFGLLGPNGAGKTTLVKIMLTIVHPNHARGTVFGRPIGHKPTLRKVGYLPEDHRFPPYLTALQALEYYAALSGVSRRERKFRAAELLDVVGMSDWAHQRLGTFSKGMLQRVGLAQAMVHDPELIVLDEPTDGLDPIGRRDVRNVLIRLRDQKKTIFINSHLLSELEMVCDRVAILNAGLIIRQGTLKELTQGRNRYEIALGSGDPAEVTELVRQALERPHTVYVKAGRLCIDNADAEAIQPVLDALRRKGLVLASVQPVQQSLEELFVEAVNGLPPDGEVPGASPRKGGAA